MKRYLTGLLLFVFATACHTTAPVETSKKELNIKERYRLAQSYYYISNGGLVAESNLESPVWLNDTNAFIYRYYPKNKSMRYMWIDPDKKIKKELFDHKRLAEGLGTLLKKKIEHNWLPIGTVRLNKGNESFTFVYEKRKYRCNWTSYVCSEVIEKKIAAVKVPAALGHNSPDNKWVVYDKDYNLFLRNLKTGTEKQLTTNGSVEFQYGGWNVSPKDKMAEHDNDLHYWSFGQWSPDSTKFVTYTADFRGVPKTTLTQSCPKDGSKQHVYDGYFIYAGQENVIDLTYHIVDVKTAKLTKLDLPPQPLINFGVPYGRAIWLPSSKSFYMATQNRGRTKVDLLKFDSVTGKSSSALELTSTTSIPEQLGWYHFINEMKGCLRLTENDGWAHIYNFDLTKPGKPKQLTNGEWAVSKIIKLDHKKQTIFFMAGGRENERDPYLQHLYRVNFDGTGFKLLTPENADHTITFLPSGKYFLDTYSRTDLPGKTVLRSTEGEFIHTLLVADDSKLRKRGYIYPETFTAKGRDGKTDIYGTVYRPNNFDPSKKYPIIESIYPGPHNFTAEKKFTAWYSREISLAQLGFIVVQIDGMGSWGRSKAFRDVTYKNLKDAGFPDRIAWVKALAKKYPYIDISRVGITGHSAGGYASVRAMLDYPDFYKVCVSSAGNHDHTLGGFAGWAEMWMGFPYGVHYKKNSNVTDAHKLKGRLLLMHGETDENVLPTTTLRLANALNKAGKHYQMIYIPNNNHAFEEHIWTRHRWNFFVRHLLGEEPPLHYDLNQKIKIEEKPTQAPK